MKCKKLISFSALLIISLIPEIGVSFEIRMCGDALRRWPTNYQTISLDSISFPIGTARSALLSAINHLNDGPSNFTLGATVNGTNPSVNNETSEAFFSDTSQHTAYVAQLLDCSDSTETLDEQGRTIISDGAVDVVFSTPTSPAARVFAYSVGDAYLPGIQGSDGLLLQRDLREYGGGAFGGGQENRTFNSTALHELGHFYGLKHSTTIYNLMGLDRTHIHANGFLAQAYVGEDASHGAVYLYGESDEQRENLSVSHWKFDPDTAADANYSRHKRTEIYDQGGNPLTNAATGNNEQIYEVWPGQRISVEFTLENSGTTNYRVPVAYYYSTNDFITTNDTFLEETQRTINRNLTYEYRRTINIPMTVSVGDTDAIGIIVDSYDDIEEVNEFDNATYIKVRIIERPRTIVPQSRSYLKKRSRSKIQR